MELGKRIKECRLAAGLSQRQLCGDYMTRNMLSQIESGTARPSMDTLSYLAQQLGKTVSFFLEEQTVTSPNLEIMARARTALALEQPQQLEEALAEFREPDDTFYEERQLLQLRLYLLKARQAMENGQQPYAVTLLHRALELNGLYITAGERRSCLILLGQAGEPVELPEEDTVLLLRAQQTDLPRRRLELLAAAEDHSGPMWNYLQAEAEFALKRYAEAAAHYALSEQNPDTIARQEDCYRELGDFKRAYEFAVLLRTP